MPLQAAIAQVGAGKQTAKGSAAANPTYLHGITDGQVITVDVQQDLEDRTTTNRVSPAVNRTGVLAGIDFTGRVHAASAGLWLFGSLGSVSTTGSTTFTHTITSAADLPYLTCFGQLDSNRYSVQDVKVSDLALSWNQNEPVEMSVQGMGTVIGFPASLTPTTNDTFATYMRPAGGTFQLDVDSATPVTAKIQAGELSIANNLSEILLSGSVVPDDVMVGRQEVECSFDLVPNDLTDWRTIVTGTSGGTTASAVPIYGSFSCQFTDGTNTLTIAASRVAFTMDFPSADPAGGAVTVSMAGLCVQPAAGGTPCTVTLVNGTASY